jgi:hypothetical protein
MVESQKHTRVVTSSMYSTALIVQVLTLEPLAVLNCSPLSKHCIMSYGSYVS